MGEQTREQKIAAMNQPEPTQGRSRFTSKAWDAIDVLEKELEQLGCKRLVLQPHKKFERAIAYTE